MSLYVKVILCIFALAYFISPVDIIPDILLPYIGWLDDGVVIATIIYMLRHGRLPDFIFKRKPKFTSSTQKKDSGTFSGGSQARQKNSSQKEYGQHRKSSNQKEKAATGPKSPHEVLGLTPGATKSQIQAAYKAAVKKYHPDKLSHLGEEFSTLASEKFLEVQKAYDELMKQWP